ncbi:MAG: DUF5372 family protein, partial [Gammaproteobacteria bacterium]
MRIFEPIDITRDRCGRNPSRRPAVRASIECWAFPRLERTTQVANESLGWAEVRHPFHPLKGQRFPVLKTRRVGGT